MFLWAQTEDVVTWLTWHTNPEDLVTVHMDLGQGREFELLQALLSSNMLGLIDHLAIRWQYQLAVRFWLLPVLEGICPAVAHAFGTVHLHCHALYNARA